MKTRLDRLSSRQLNILAGILLATGYVNIGSVNVTNKEFHFDLRGPVFWRLTNGLPPLLHQPGSDFYVQFEAYMAYMLLTGNARVDGIVVASSSIMLRVRSSLFEWKRLATETSFRTLSVSKAALALLNFAIGIQLVEDRLPFVITAINFPEGKEIRFVTTAHTVQREERKLPSMFTIPDQTKTIRALNKIIGTMLTVQILRIVTVSMGRGGELGFTIRGNIFRFRKFLSE